MLTDIMSYLPGNVGHQLTNMPNMRGQSRFVPQPAAQSTFVPQSVGHSLYVQQPATQSMYVPQSAGHSMYVRTPAGHPTFEPQPALYVMPNGRGNMRNNRRKRRGVKKAKDERSNATTTNSDRVELLENQGIA